MIDSLVDFGYDVFGLIGAGIGIVVIVVIAIGVFALIMMAIVGLWAAVYYVVRESGILLWKIIKEGPVLLWYGIKEEIYRKPVSSVSFFSSGNVGRVERAVDRIFFYIMLVGGSILIALFMWVLIPATLVIPFVCVVPFWIVLSFYFHKRHRDIEAENKNTSRLDDS